MEKITCINGDILKWARLSSGDLQLKAIKDKFDKIQKWENGEDYPTYSQLEDLSNIYKKPIALFFFPKPPQGYELKADFRTMSDQGFKTLSYKVIRLIHEANVMQLNIKELTEDPMTPSFILHNQLKKVPSKNLLAETRKLLGITISDQLNTKSAKEMLEVWRDAFCKNGLYVFKEAFHDNNVSGFCIYDEKFPIIYLNNSMSYTRQIFTLFHELYHMIRETSGVDMVRESDENDLTTTQLQIERNCNRFSAEFLIPTNKLLRVIGNKDITFEFVSELADKFCVSKEAMTIRLISEKKLTWDFYKANIVDINNDFLRVKPKSPGGNFNNNLISYLGKRYLKLAFSAHREGKIDDFQLASFTKTNVNNLSALERAWGWKD